MSSVSRRDVASRTLPSGRETVLDRRLHREAEAVELLERRVDARRDADAAELGVDDRDGEDAMRLPEPVAELRRVEAVDLHVGDAAGEARIEAGVQAHA